MPSSNQPRCKFIKLVFVLILHCASINCNNSFVRSSTYLGVGYDIRTGNPYGRSLYEGGLDPGIKVSQNVLENTILGDDPCPVEAKCTAIYASDREFIFIDDFQKYQESLERYWNIKQADCETCSPLGISPKTTGSGSNVRYEIDEFLKRKEIGVFSKRIHVHAEAKYRVRQRPRLNEDFLEDLCVLPQEFNEQTKDILLGFIRSWGTHVITEASLGEVENELKFFTEEDYVYQMLQGFKELTNKTIINKMLYVTISSAAIRDRVDDVWQRMSEFDDDGLVDSSYNNEYGSMFVPVPISITLESITSFISDDFIGKSNRACSRLNSDNIKDLQKSIEKAQLHYLQHSAQKEPEIIRQAESPWPQGTYSLPMAVEGCPDETWKSGARQLDLTNSRNETAWSELLPQRMKGEYNQNPTLYFCTKVDDPELDDDDDIDVDYDDTGFYFEAGSYCILKQKVCPAQFHDASAFFPRDYQNPDVDEVGMVPPPEKQPTSYNFCCRNDSNTASAISLPVGTPFLLFPVTPGKCQEVKGMKWDLQWMVFETEDGLLKDNSVMGYITPWVEKFANKQPNRNFKMYFCYYFLE